MCGILNSCWSKTSLLLDAVSTLSSFIPTLYSDAPYSTFPWNARFTLISHWAPPKKKVLKHFQCEGIKAQQAGTRKLEICKTHDTLKCKCAANNKRSITLVHPPFPDGIEGNMHAKMILLCFKNKIRVIITSANLQNRDWDAVIQSVWSQDFFLGSPTAPRSPFGRSLF